MQKELTVSQTPVQYEKFSGCPNGIALWMDWELEDGITLNSGPRSTSQTNELEWDMNSKQGVFFTHSKEVLDTNDIQIKYNRHSGDIDMSIIKCMKNLLHE